jgi:ABC-type sulfate/molybdate transport systems ATPase subunit
LPLEIQIEKKLPEFTLDVSFTCGDEPLSVLGPSGAGKTMLLRCIAGLERARRGRVALGNRLLFDHARNIRLPARDRRVGMLFQHFALFPNKTVGENIAFGLHQFPREDRQRRVAGLLTRTHIDGLQDRYPHQISGGEQQRAALARALATDPEALLLDEPLSALDTHLRSQMEAQLQETFGAYRRPTLLVTHNIEEAYRLGERLLVLSRGRIAAFGDKREIFLRPPSLEVARLTGCKNFSRARMTSPGVAEAVDWGCQLRVLHEIKDPVAHLGIRAHEIDFVEAGAEPGAQANVFPCWLVRTSETPFRVTLYLSLHQPTGGASEDFSVDLQAEVTKEKFRLIQERPIPWYVKLSRESLFLLADSPDQRT